MLSPKVSISDAVTPRLQQLYNQVAPGRRAPLVRKLGAAAESVLREHFRQRNLSSQSTSKRASKGFPQAGIWERIRSQTALSASDDNKAVISIGDPAFRSKLFGAVIRPGAGRKFLAIPLRAIVYNKPPRGNPVPGMFVRWARGKGYLASTEVPGREGRLTVLYRLISRVRVPRDPEAMPAEGVIGRKLVRIAAREVGRG